MKNNMDFKAWRDIDPPGDFTQNVMRRIRSAPAREPRWRELMGAFFASRLAFGTALAASFVLTIFVFSQPAQRRAPVALQPNSLIVAYAKLAEGK